MKIALKGTNFTLRVCIYNAHTGELIEPPVREIKNNTSSHEEDSTLPSVTVDRVKDLKQFIEHCANIPVKDQILLNVEGVTLRDNHLFDSYKNKDKIFVYSRVLEKRNKRQYIPDKLDFPSADGTPQQLPQNQISKDLFTDFKHGAYLAQRAKLALDSASQMYNNMVLQCEGMRTAYKNLGGHRQVILKHFNEVNEKFEQHEKKLNKIQEEFNLQEAEKTELHPLLQHPEKKIRYLIDLLPPKESIKHYKNECDSELGKLIKIIADLKSDVSKLEQLDVPLDLDYLVQNLENEKTTILNELHSFHNNQRVLTESTTKSLREYTADKKRDFEAYATIHEQQTAILAKMRQNDALIQERVIRMKEIVDRSYNEFNRRLKLIIDAEVELHQVKEQTDAFSSAFEKLEEKFSTLIKFDRLTAAYKIALLEVTRRNQFRKNFEVKLELMFERLQQQFKEEMDIRQTFNSEIGRYLPRAIIPGLLEPPTPFTPPIPSIQITNLPKIEVDPQSIIADETISKLFTENFNLNDVKNLLLHRKKLEKDLNILLDYMSDINTKVFDHTSSMSTDLDINFDEDRREYDQLKEEKEQLARQLSELKKELDTEKEQNRLRNEERQRSEDLLSQQLKDMTDKWRQLTLDVIKCKQENKQLEESFDGYKKKSNEQVAALQQEMETEKQKYEKAVNTMESALKRADSERAKLENLLETTRIELANAQQEKISSSQINTETDRLLKQLRVDKDKLASELEASNIQIEKCRREIEELSMSELQAKTERDQLQQRIGSVAKDNQELKKTVIEVSNERDRLQLENGQLECKMNELDNNVLKILDEKESLQRRVTSLEQELSNLNESMKMIMDENNQLQDQVEHILDIRQNTIKQDELIKSLKNKLKQIEEENAIMKTNTAHLQESIKKLETENQTISKLKEELQKALEHSNMYRDALTSTLEWVGQRANLIGATSTDQVISEILSLQRFSPLITDTSSLFKEFEDEIMKKFFGYSE